MILRLTYGIHPRLIWDHNLGLGSIIYVYVYNVAKAMIMISNRARLLYKSLRRFWSCLSKNQWLKTRYFIFDTEESKFFCRVWMREEVIVPLLIYLLLVTFARGFTLELTQSPTHPHPLILPTSLVQFSGLNNLISTRLIYEYHISNPWWHTAFLKKVFFQRASSWTPKTCFALGLECLCHIYSS